MKLIQSLLLTAILSAGFIGCAHNHSHKDCDSKQCKMKKCESKQCDLKKDKKSCCAKKKSKS